MAPLDIAGLEIPWTKAVPPEDTTDMASYVKQSRKAETLPKGWQKTKNSRPLPCEVILEQNAEITHRDGTKIFCDIVRPVTQQKVPALLALSPYGKGGHGFFIYENSPFRLGIPESTTSGLEKFESVDPAEWAQRGYAVVNVDIRGSWESEGNIYIEGSQPGIDAYDIIEHVAALDWCNGSIGMQGNSWLATTQWTAAAQRPPSLKAIAPWEGFTDKYREVVCRGGIPNVNFAGFIFNKTIRGRNLREDIGAALVKWPLQNAYWADKNIDTSKITIPTYALASYSSAIHGFGTIKAFNSVNTTKKWLRVHSTQEWFDLYRPENNDELQKFFDRYLKNIDNGWEKTTPVRVSVLTFGDRNGPKPIQNIPFTEYPPKSTEHKTLFLSSSGKLLFSPAKTASTTSYQSDDMHAKPAEFTYIFDAPATLIGYSKAKLWVSCPDNDDLDLYLSLRKISKSGKVLEHINIPWDALPSDVKTQDDVPNTNTIKYLGPTGLLRVSHRAQDPKRSTPIIPYHPHDKEDKMPPGTIVPVEIGIWPMGITFEKGEGLMLRVQGFMDQCREFPKHIDAKPKNGNKGRHVVHFGGEYDSNLLVPFVPV